MNHSRFPQSKQRKICEWVFLGGLRIEFVQVHTNEKGVKWGELTELSFPLMSVLQKCEGLAALVKKE